MKSLLSVFLFAFGLTPSYAIAQGHPKVELGKLFLKPNGQPRTFAIVTEDGAVMHDFIAAYSILDFVSKDDFKFHFVALKKGLKKDGLGKIQFMADTTIDEIPKPDILLIGGIVNMELFKNKKFMAWLKNAYENSEMTMAICSGGVLLAASGATTGKKAAVGYFSKNMLNSMGGIFVPDSVFVDGKLLSASGISGGTEIAFELIERITSRKDIPGAINLMLEFNPILKYGAGDFVKAPEPTKAIAKDISAQLGFPSP